MRIFIPNDNGSVSELCMSTLLFPDKMAASMAAPMTTASSASMEVFTSFPPKCSLKEKFHDNSVNNSLYLMTKAKNIHTEEHNYHKVAAHPIIMHFQNTTLRIC